MKKFYPYLRDAYLSNFTQEQQEKNFLAKINKFINRKLYVQITLLDWQENPLKSFEGEIVSGNQSKDGASSVRHTCSLACTVDRGMYSIDDIESDYSINKKVFIEIGIRNDTDEYPEYPILWFPQGVYFINSIGITSSTTGGVNLSLTFKDKMCMLSGDLGGKFGSTVTFDVMDTQLPSGEYAEEKVLVYNIIQELVNHYGGEDLNNIVIEDVPLKIKRVMKWTGSNPLYVTNMNTSEESFSRVYSLTEPQYEDDEEPSHTTFNYGDDVGYIWDDFFYTDELVAGPAETITSVLDKIKTYLGNFEYFYDVYGIFRFREIKNYVNTTLAKNLLTELSENDYTMEVNNDKTSFIFSDSENITSITVTPKYNNIKNDFIVQGLRPQSESDLSFPIMYHLAIDDKPELFIDENGSHYGGYENIILYEDPDTKECRAYALREKTDEELPDVGNFNLIYRDSDNSYVYWDGETYQPVTVKETYLGNKKYYCKDWRTKLYMDGVVATNFATDPGYYWPELSAYWPQTYDLLNQRFWGEETAGLENAYRSLTEGVYYLDFIDSSSSELGKYSVKNIGRRTNVTVDDKINCLFQPEIPNIILIDRAASDKEKDAIKSKCKEEMQPWSQVPGEIYNALATGGYHNGAFDQIKYDLYLHTHYQRSVSLTVLPAYWLEPNTRVLIDESTTNTYGDFMISNINYAFGPSATMTVSCTEVKERF